MNRCQSFCHGQIFSLPDRHQQKTTKNNNNLANEWVNITSPLHMTQYSTTKLHQPWPNTAVPMHGDVAGEKGNIRLYLLVPSDVLIPQNSPQEGRQLILRLDEAAGGCHHGGCQRPGHPSRRQELCNVGGQPERDWTVGIQVTWWLEIEGRENKTVISNCALFGDTGLRIIYFFKSEGMEMLQWQSKNVPCLVHRFWWSYWKSELKEEWIQFSSFSFSFFVH